MVHEVRRAMLVIAGIVAWMIVPAAADAAKVDVSASVSGSTLSVDYAAAANSECKFRLGSGSRATDLPAGTTDATGAGTVAYDLPGDVRGGRRAVSASCVHRGNVRTGKAYVMIPAGIGADGSSAVATVLNVLLDLLLGGSLVLFSWLLIEMVVKASDPGEKLMRALALIGGAVIALAAQAAGVSFADFTVDTLTGARPGGGAFKAFSAVVPGGMGALFAWYFVRVMRRSADMALRFMSFLGMLTIVAFAVVFAEATHVQGVMLGAAAIPNASFVVGLIGGVVVFMPPADAQGSGRRRWQITDLLGRHGRAQAIGFAPSGSDGPSDRARAPRRNPFADD